MNRWAQRCIAVGILAATLGFEQLTQGQDKTALAETLFKQGIELARSERYAEACAKLKASFALDPARGTLLALALAEEKDGKPSAALAHYRDLIGMAQRADDRERLAQAQAHAAALQAKVALLSIEASGPLAPGTTIFLDETLFPLEALGVAVPVDPGKHSVRAQASDGTTFSASVELKAGQSSTLRVVLWPKTGAPRAAAAPSAASQVAPTSLFTVGCAASGLGAILLGVGAGLWIKSGQTYDDVSAACPDKNCPPTQRDSIDRGRREDTWATVALLSGAVGLTSGVVLMALGWKKSPAAPTQFVAGANFVGVTGGF